MEFPVRVKTILAMGSSRGRLLLILGAIFITNFEVVNGFSVGVPPLRSVCLSMNPQHHDYVSQGSDPPYEVSVNKNEVSGGDNVEFSLKHKESEKKTKFIGFYIQARDENDSPIGTFIPNKDTKVHSCGGIRANAAHHASGNVKKDNVTISWTAPREFQGEVVFTATAVENFVTYWVYMQTDPVMVMRTEALPFLALPTLFTGSGSPSPSVRRPSVNSISQPTSTSPQTQSQLGNIGGGIRMLFQNLQMTANRLGRLFIPPIFRPGTLNNDSKPSELN